MKRRSKVFASLLAAAALLSAAGDVGMRLIVDVESHIQHIIVEGTGCIPATARYTCGCSVPLQPALQVAFFSETKSIANRKNKRRLGYGTQAVWELVSAYAQTN